MIIPVKFSVGGWYQLDVIKVDACGRRGARRRLAGPFPNLITDSGMDYIGNGVNQFQSCKVGSGNTPPANTDTALVALVASSTDRDATRFVGVSPLYAGSNVSLYEFPVGAAAGNLSEVGIGPSVGNLFSRALILDGGGSPTTITVLPDEILQVTYIGQQFPNLIDVASIVNISAVPYDTVIRPALVNDGNESNLYDLDIACIPKGTASVSGRAYETQTLGAVTGTPAGVARTTTSAVAAAYSPGSYFRDITWSWAIAQGNLTLGIGSVVVQSTRGSYQCSFDPRIPKDATKTLTLTFRFSWVRHVYP